MQLGHRFFYGNVVERAYVVTQLGQVLRHQRSVLRYNSESGRHLHKHTLVTHPFGGINPHCVLDGFGVLFRALRIFPHCHGKQVQVLNIIVRFLHPIGGDAGNTLEHVQVDAGSNHAERLCGFFVGLRQGVVAPNNRVHLAREHRECRGNLLHVVRKRSERLVDLVDLPCELVEINLRQRIADFRQLLERVDSGVQSACLLNGTQGRKRRGDRLDFLHLDSRQINLRQLPERVHRGIDSYGLWDRTQSLQRRHKARDPVTRSRRSRSGSGEVLKLIGNRGKAGPTSGSAFQALQ